MQPISAIVLLNNSVTFSVFSGGLRPLSYQWRLNDNPITDATNASLILPSVQAADAGNYSVQITNPVGATTSSDATLTVTPLSPFTFQILSLTTNNSRLVEISGVVGDDRAGIAVGPNRVIVTGDTRSGHYNAGDLSGATNIDRIIDGLLTDLRTGTIYALASGTNEFTRSGGAVDALIELDEFGQPTGRRIPLTTALNLSSASGGVFNGYGLVLIVSNGRLYEILLPSGIVTDRGSFTRPSFQTSESWAVWGVAEHFAGETYIAYRKSSTQGIYRTRISDGQESLVSEFTNLGDLATFIVSPARDRWFFHHESSSQFGSSTEALGSADAVVNYLANAIAPFIDVQPTGVRQLAGRPVSFRVQAVGSAPLTYQWRSNGVDIAGATLPVFTIPSIQTNDAATYSVFVNNGQGSLTSSNAVLTVLPPRADGLKILGFGTNQVQIVDVLSNTGDDRGGLALSSSHVFITGDTRTAGFAAGDLSNPVNASRIIDGLCADLQTRTIYALSDGTNELSSSTGTLRELVTLNGTNASPTGVKVPLSRSIELPSGRIGLFSGWGRIMIYASGRVYEILLPDGDVFDLGAMPEPPWTATEIGDVNGVVENFGGSLYLTYPRTSTESIDRARVPDGAIETITSFVELGDFGALTIWPEQNRWYFKHETSSQFGGTSETLGFGEAFFDIETIPQGPGILANPVSRNAMEGGIVRFQVQAVGAGALTNQWLFNGNPINGATNAVLDLSSLQSSNAGNYSIRIGNAHGTVTSSTAALTVLPLEVDTFHILNFGTNNSLAVNATTPTGDDRGGIALSSTHVFSTGDTATGAYDLGLTNGASVGRVIDGLCYDIRTLKTYALGNGTNELTTSGGVLNTLIELHDATGNPTGNLIRLTENIAMTSSGNGIFSGYGRLIVYASGRMYDILIPSGSVTDLGAMTKPNWQSSEIWATWGIAEKSLGTLSIVYHQSGGEIMARTRVPNGATSVITTLTKIPDLASFAVHPNLQRWYYRYEGLGQFFPSNTEVLGYADVGLNRQTAPQVPVLTVQPESMTQLTPRPVAFRVQAFGTPPLGYQWRSNGVDIIGANGPVFSIPSVQVSDAASYTVHVSNGQGSVTSSNAVLTVLPLRDDLFKINTLLADNAQVVEVTSTAGDDRAGIAVTPSNVFVTGDTETRLYHRESLTNVADLNRLVDGLVSDLKTDKVYALANGTNEVTVSGTIVDTLVELDGNTGAPTGNTIPLSRGIGWVFSQSGIFSGFGRFMFYTEGRMYEVLLPEGVVFDHGKMIKPPWAITEMGPTWGVAESFDGTLQVAYVNPSNESIERAIVPDGTIAKVAGFTDLGDIAAFTVSLRQHRWFFRHEGVSQFSSLTETLGYADAELSFAGANPLVGVFDNPLFVDTSNTPTAESDNVQATVNSLNYLTRTYSSLALAASRRDVLIIPDLENGSPISVGQVPGPVILGGDDLTEHGNVSGGANQLGWLYVQNSIANLNRDQTRPGPFTVDIAALGTAATTSTSGTAGGAIGSAATVLGLTVNFYNGAAAIQGFFSALATNGTNPKIIWLAGTDATDDLDSSEGGILTANAGTIAQFVGEGGGLMAHGGDDGATAYGWLNNFRPDIVLTSAGTSSGHRLTDIGRATLPLLTDANIDSGPSHNWFGGNLSGFEILGLDANDHPFILGGRGSAFNNRQALINLATGGGVLIVHGSPGTPTNALTLLNEVLGTTLTGSAQGAGSLFSRTVAAGGTPFADDPAVLTANNDTMTLDTSSLPAGAKSLYETNGQSLVASIPLGAGQIVFLGWDWNNAQPAGTQAPAGWANVMDSAIALKGTNSATPPIITVQPRDAAIAIGGDVSMNVGAVGSQPLVYQWRHAGTNLLTQTGTSLILSGITTNHAGIYNVVVTNSFGSVTSRQAIVTVQPAIDRFEFEPIASPQYTNMPFEVAIRAFDGASNIVQLFNSTVTMATSAGASVPVLPGVTGVFTNGFWRGVIRITNAVTNITINVDDGSSHRGTSSVFTVTAPTLLITLHPQSVVTNWGATVQLQAAGTGNIAPLNFQWQKDGAPILDATNSTLTFSNATRLNGGLYAAALSDSATTLLTSNAIVRVRVPQVFQPPWRLGNGHLRLRFGDNGGGSLASGDLVNFRVEASTNFVDWQLLTNPLVLTNGLIEIIDPNTPLFPRRFYRTFEQ